MSIDQLRYLKTDINRYFYPNNDVTSLSLFRKLLIIVFTQGIWAITVYRLQRWALYEFRIPILNKIIFWIMSVFELIVQITSGINIEVDSDIGPGFYIGHFGNIFIPAGVKIGKFCNVSQENTFGVAGRGNSRGLPEIGDFVFVGAGAKVIGKIKVGNNVAIGANSVVTKDIPDNAVVGGVPAKIINYNTSKDFIEYNQEKSKRYL